MFSKYGLNLHQAGYDADYDMHIEGAVLNEFAVIFPYILWTLLPNDAVFTSFNNPTKVFEPRGVENVLHQLLTTNIYIPGLRVNDEVWV